MSATELKLQVFLCHASQDKLTAKELYEALNAEAWIDPWLDKAKILPGQDWRTVIEKAVEDSDAVIVCISTNSVGKEGFIQKEIRYAYDIALEKPEGTIFLIPLRLEEVTPPRGLRNLQWVDYFGSEKQDHFRSLLEALKLRYEQRLPVKFEEQLQKQQEEKERQEYEELKRKEQETVRRTMQERERKEAKERAKFEAERSADHEMAAENERYSREKSDTDIDDIIPKNHTATVIAFVTVLAAFCFCIFLALLWQYGDLIFRTP
ncbi:MAG: hypothetical protein CNIPEHKO_03065 [Anaerolineales bacterium]|nr:hypothetical protein [Anaerolineales bacterium]